MWGVATSADDPGLQARRGGSVSTTLMTSFTRMPAATQPAPFTLSGAVVVTNPTSEAIELNEVEVSWVTGSSPQMDVAATCPTSVGTSVMLQANSQLTCYFSLTYTGAAPASIWASTVAASGQVGMSDAVPFDPSAPGGNVTDTGACATLAAGFAATGAPGALTPASYAAGGNLPPSLNSPATFCGSQTFVYTANFGPLSACGSMQATSTATANPVGGPQSTQSAQVAVNIAVLC
jgi:hypothetical protein